MSATQISTTSTYLPAVLKRTPSVGWLVEYYALNPATEVLQRKQVKLQRIAKRYAKVSEFKQHANMIVAQINGQLAGGWSPFFSTEDARLHTKISVVLELFLKDKSKELRPHTLRSYSSFVRMFGEFCEKSFPGLFCGMFQRIHAVRYGDYLTHDRKVGPYTYNNHVKMGRAFMNWSKENLYTRENPFELLKTRKKTEKRRILIPPADRERIMEYCQEHCPEYVIVLELVYYSLVRPKEIQRIQLEHIDWERNTLRIPGANAKNHHERFTVIPPVLMERKHRYERVNKKYYLFSDNLTASKDHCHDSKLRKMWDKMRRALKLPLEMQLYSLRDTGITEKLQAGIPAVTVMKLADHSDLSITTRYAKHADKQLIATIMEQAPVF